MSLASDNFKDLMSIVETINFKRDPSKLLEFLTEGDFFVAPASAFYHGNFEGGLYNHCKHVYNILIHLNKLLPEENKFSEESLFYVSFCHDLCKINNYKIVEKWKKDKFGKWEAYNAYEEQETFPCGHATKSIVLALPLVSLTKEEIVAIRYHMGSFMEIDNYSNRIYSDARQFSYLTTMLQSADIIASDIFEEIKKY